MNDTTASRALCAARPRATSIIAILFTLLPLAAGAQTLPAGWAVSDVRSPAIPGYASESSGTYTVGGAGIGIGAKSDQFTFAYRMLTGDGTIVARVAGIANATSNAQVGVMMREGLDGGARHVSLLAGSTKQLFFKRRTGAGSTTSNLKVTGVSVPTWLKLERRGSTITASQSANGSTWTLIGSQNIAMGGTLYVGLAVTSYTEVAAVRASFTNVQVAGLAQTGGTLPQGWTSQDIGGPGKPGSAAYDAATGTYAIVGGGTDIAQTWDQFHYSYMRVDGNVDIVARVRAVGSKYARAGIMVRDGLTPNGAYASMFFINAYGTAFQRRPTPGASMVTTAWTSAKAPMWVKLSVRSGTITGYRSTDGVTWTQVGTQVLTLPSPFYIGLAVSSRDNSTTVTANIDNVRVEASSPAVNQKPTVSLTAPANGATYTAPATMTLTASAADTDGSVARVEFYQGSTLIGSDSSSPYSMSWSNVAAGTYTLTAVAIDNDGASTTSAARTVTVNPAANQPPSVSLTGPANGATFTAGASITISANASDTDGTIARVDFYRGSTLIASDSTSPYSVTWSNAVAGTYSLTARAIDDDGATTTSAARSITVNPAANQPPSVSLTAPANGATFTAGASITISANASDADGTIARVEFYRGSTLIASDTTSPYSVTWSNVPAGAYSLTARAVDNSGAVTTSSARSITVNAVTAQQRTAVFAASPDHSTLVTSYRFDVFAAGANPATATPIATQNLGKPAVVNGEISADVTTTINSLAAGSYQATVSAIGSGGSSRSAPATFTR